jgi:hypothetical protein
MRYITLLEEQVPRVCISYVTPVTGLQNVRVKVFKGQVRQRGFLHGKEPTTGDLGTQPEGDGGWISRIHNLLPKFGGRRKERIGGFENSMCVDGEEERIACAALRIFLRAPSMPGRKVVINMVVSSERRVSSF